MSDCRFGVSPVNYPDPERSSCRMFASDNELIARYMAVSSAKQPDSLSYLFWEVINVWQKKNGSKNRALRDTRRHRDAVRIDTVNNN